MLLAGAAVMLGLLTTAVLRNIYQRTPRWDNREADSTLVIHKRSNRQDYKCLTTRSLNPKTMSVNPHPSNPQTKGGPSPRFYTRLPAPVEVGRRPPMGGGGGSLEGGVQGGGDGGGGGAVGRVGWGGVQVGQFGVVRGGRGGGGRGSPYLPLPSI